MFIDITHGPLRQILTVSCTVPLRGRQNEFREHVRDISGHERLLDGLMLAKDPEDGAEPSCHKEPVCKPEDIPEPLPDHLVMRSGHHAVKVKPQTRAARLRRIAVRLVAVQQHERVFPHFLLLSGIVQKQCAFLNIHQQKAVKRTPLKPVSRLIRKIAALERIKEGLLGGFAR